MLGPLQKYQITFPLEGKISADPRGRRALLEGILPHSPDLGHGYTSLLDKMIELATWQPDRWVTRLDGQSDHGRSIR
jgi:hypothetical protein